MSPESKERLLAEMEGEKTALLRHIYEKEGISPLRALSLLGGSPGQGLKRSLYTRTARLDGGTPLSSSYSAGSERSRSWSPPADSFNSMDLDGDGVIDRDEWEAGCEKQHVQREAGRREWEGLHTPVVRGGGWEASPARGIYSAPGTAVSPVASSSLRSPPTSTPTGCPPSLAAGEGAHRGSAVSPGGTRRLPPGTLSILEEMQVEGRRTQLESDQAILLQHVYAEGRLPLKALGSGSSTRVLEAPRAPILPEVEVSVICDSCTDDRRPPGSGLRGKLKIEHAPGTTNHGRGKDDVVGCKTQ